MKGHVLECKFMGIWPRELDSEVDSNKAETEGTRGTSLECQRIFIVIFSNLEEKKKI